jgi:hypothetical protein
MQLQTSIGPGEGGGDLDRCQVFTSLGRLQVCPSRKTSWPIMPKPRRDFRRGQFFGRVKALGLLVARRPPGSQLSELEYLQSLSS